ncbi:hypothetical protein GCM10010527_53420 [Streptomyces drozdowiczii]
MNHSDLLNLMCDVSPLVTADESTAGVGHPSHPEVLYPSHPHMPHQPSPAGDVTLWAECGSVGCGPVRLGRTWKVSRGVFRGLRGTEQGMAKKNDLSKGDKVS